MKNNSQTILKNYLQLSKLTIMLPVSLTGFTGYFIYDPHLSVRIILLTLGVLFMAISASALNQVQEAIPDSIMERTRNRPVPSGRISKSDAVIFAGCSLLAGLLLIWFNGTIQAVLTGLFTIFWYNGVYTLSKRVTAFAVVPGALTGALPPLIGWLAAGGGMWDKHIIFLEFLFFIGQIPHFWLLILRYGKDYKLAGFPVITDVFKKDQINRLTFTWILTSVIAALFLPFFGIIRNLSVIVILLAASVFVVWNFAGLIKEGTDERSAVKYSRMLDLYFLLILLLLITDRIIKIN
jgi:heme o synthase